jgi:hypothetical protein
MMSALHRNGGDVAAKPGCAAENQKPHAHSRRREGQFAQRNSPTAQHRRHAHRNAAGRLPGQASPRAGKRLSVNAHHCPF